MCVKQEDEGEGGCPYLNTKVLAMEATFVCLEEDDDYSWHAHEDALDYTWLLVGVQNLVWILKSTLFPKSTLSNG